VVRRGHPIGQTPNTEEFLAVRQVAISLSGSAGLIDIELAERGLKRKIALVINHFGLLPRLIAESDLASIVPIKVVQESGYSDQLQLIDLPFPLQSRTVSLLWHERSDHSAEHRWMQDQLLQRSQTDL
jgi:DNA-binding transcriptional LysR family regulator